MFDRMKFGAGILTGSAFTIAALRLIEHRRAAVAQARPPQPMSVPNDAQQVVIPTEIGEVTLQAAEGYYRGAGIFVFLPDGASHDPLVARAFNRVTDGEFHLDRAPISSMGGISTADGLITAGLDYAAHCARKQGYFKSSTPPTMEQAANALRLAIWEVGQHPEVLA